MSSLNDATQSLRPQHSPDQFHGPSTPQNAHSCPGTLSASTSVTVLHPGRNCLEHLPSELLFTILALNGDTFIDCQLLSKNTYQRVLTLLPRNRGAILSEIAEVCGRTSFYRNISIYATARGTGFYRSLKCVIQSEIKAACSRCPTLWEIRHFNRDFQKREDEEVVRAWRLLCQTVPKEENPGPVVPAPDGMSERNVRKSAQTIRTWIAQNPDLLDELMTKDDVKASIQRSDLKPLLYQLYLQQERQVQKLFKSFGILFQRQ